jgi:hypothetical protein
VAPKGSKNRDLETAQAIDRATKPQDDIITLSSGVVLRGKQANPLILVQVMAAFPRPEPPVQFIQVMGREVENPDDPDYIERLQAWKMEFADRMVTAMIALGTEFVSAPKGLSQPEKNDWLDDFSVLGLKMFPENKSWRYMTWVKFKAVRDETDMQAIQELVGRLSGVRESAVKSAENFPGSGKADR